MCLLKMSINFDRNYSQVEYERMLGYSDISEIDKNIFKNYQLSSNDVQALKETAKKDAINFFYNGIISFSEGIDSALKKSFSWATVKLYYSIYYLIRASLAAKNIVLLRCKSMYRLELSQNSSPYNTGNKRYNTTHEGTINHYRDLYGSADLLLSNKIDDFDAYEWMMNVREIINYRCATFLEPGHLEIWSQYAACIEDNTIVELFDLIISDQRYIYPFQEEYAVIAIPVKRLIQTIKDLGDAGLLNEFQPEKIGYLQNITQNVPITSNVLNSFIGNR